MKDNIWFINFNGIGNGIILAPILACFEKSYPRVKYFHTENEVLANGWFRGKAGIYGPSGYSPIDWRRFKKEDWPVIINFIQEKNIGTIVNLRNEGPKYDIGYYNFKKFFKEKEVEYFDLDFTEIESRSIQKNLTTDIIALFHQLGVDATNYNHKWLKDISISNKQGIGFGMTASNSNKKWPINKWTDLGKKLINNGGNIVLFPGIDNEEKEDAIMIQRELGVSCSVIKDLPLEKVPGEISKLELFISNDTGLLHIAAAADTPTVGLYIVTDPNIWAPLDKSNLKHLVNPNFEKCPHRKIYCGNCVHYATTCEALTNFGNGIDLSEISREIEELIGKYGS
jgi:ADP-heptose:LPS heptosyltransferase